MRRFFRAGSNASAPGVSGPPEASGAPLRARDSESFASEFHAFGNRANKTDFVWIIYSLFLIFVPLQQNNLRGWLGLAIVYPIFLFLYLGWIYARNLRRQTIVLVLMILLGFAYMPLNDGASVLFIYSAGFLPYMLEQAWPSILIVLSIYAGYAYEVERFHLSYESLGITFLLAIALCAGNLVIAQRKRLTRRLIRSEQDRAQMAKVAERERIARDLHDLLGHTLTVIALKTELAHRCFDQDTERARREIAEVEAISREALTQVRQAVTGYRMEGWPAELARARSAFDAAGITLLCEEKDPRLSPIEETMLALILREATTNILRHAKATEVRVHLVKTEQGTRLEVIDNGCGRVEQEGNGIRGMRERVAVLGGSLRLESEAGTRILIDLPVGGAQ